MASPNYLVMKGNFVIIGKSQMETLYALLLMTWISIDIFTVLTVSNLHATAASSCASRASMPQNCTMVPQPSR